MTDAPGGNEPSKVTRIGARLADAKPARSRTNGGLPVDCPVFALGQSPSHFWFLNTLQQPVAIPIGRMNGPTVRGLFSGHVPFLEQHYPKRNKDGDVIGFDVDEASTFLEDACHQMGMYDGTQEIMRGRGAHPGEDGDLIYNLGYDIWCRGGA